MNPILKMKLNPFRPLKIVILGEGGVGKTTLARTFIDNSFFADAKQTIAVSFHSTCIRLYDSDTKARVQIWDLGGQEQFKNMGVFQEYCRGADGALLCFDLTDLGSLYALPLWIEFLKPDVPRYLIATKLDIATPEEQKFDLTAFQQQFQTQLAFKCTAKDTRSIIRIFTTILESIKQIQNNIESNSFSEHSKQPRWTEIIPKLVLD
ncbi:Rab family GTPase [Candidatus Hodarchaeum mangrovi]